MAPEMFDGKYSPQSDLWAVGVIFYKLLTATLPFEGANMIHLSNVMLVCPKCSRPMRPKIDALSDGTKVRTCRKCGEMLVS